MMSFGTVLLVVISALQWSLPEASGTSFGTMGRHMLMSGPKCGPKDGKTFNMLGPVPQKPLDLPKGTAGVELDHTTEGQKWARVKLSKDVYLVTEGTYQAMFSVAGGRVIVFDSPPSLAFCMLEAIKEVTNKPISHVFYSHSHKDHIGSATLFGDGVKYMSSKRVADELKLRSDASRPVPDVTFDSREVFMIGGLKVVAKDLPGAHDDGNVLYYLPQHKVAMFVDIVYPGWAPFKHFSGAASMDKVEAALKDMLAVPADTYVCGHLGRPGTRKDVKDNLALFNFLKKTVSTVFANPANFPNALERVGDYSSNQWLLFDAFEQIQVEQCYSKLINSWGTKLGGIDVFGRTLCWSMYKHVQLELEL